MRNGSLSADLIVIGFMPGIYDPNGGTPTSESGTFNQAGGSNTIHALYIGEDSGHATYNLTGGSLTADYMTIGEGGEASSTNPAGQIRRHYSLSVSIQAWGHTI